MEYHTTSCPCCINKPEPDDLFCNGCGFPLKGTQQEQDFFYSERNAKEIDLADLNNTVESARKSLYWIAGLSVISFLFGYFTANNEQDKFIILFTSVILIGAFLVFGVWSKTKPTAALGGEKLLSASWRCNCCWSFAASDSRSAISKWPCSTPRIKTKSSSSQC